MRRLYLSHSTEKAHANAGPSILVGQRGVLSSAGATLSTTYVVAECVPCENAGVVEEQVESLERVLPFGIDVLGVSGSASEVAELVAQLHDERAEELISVVHGDGRGRPRSCHLLNAPSEEVEVVVTDVPFIEVRLALHSCEHFLPFLISSQGGSSTVVDGESYLPLQSSTAALANGARFVQLGAPTSTLRIHVVLAPAFVSARGLYDILRRQVHSAISAGATHLVEVQSHNAHISYCCRLEPEDAAGAKDISSEVLVEVFEMIEDATGVAAKHSDLRGYTSAASYGNTSSELSADAAAPLAASTSSASAAKQKASNGLLLIFLGLIAAAIGVLVIMLR